MNKILWNAPIFDGKEKPYLDKVFKEGFVSEGPMTRLLEERLRAILSAKHVIMTTSCTSALYLAIEADKSCRGYLTGDVAVPSVGFVATKNAVEMANLPIYYAGVDEAYTLKKITDIKTVDTPKIVIPTNLLGRSVNLDIINDCRRYGITCICDNAGCLGSKVPLGDVGCYSLQANKILNCAQGGFCATNSDRLAGEIRKIKDFGRINKSDNDTKGFNFKFNDILAAVALGQLDTLEDRKKRHLEIHKKYREGLGDLIAFFEMKDGEVPLWIEAKCDSCSELYEYLKVKNIYIRRPWKGLCEDENSKAYAEEYLWLPTGMHLSDKDIDKVIKEIRKFYEI